MKQTAVEWLVEQLPLIQQEGLRYVIEQAKEMEKEQIENAYEIGFADAWDDARYDDEPKHAGAEQYYKETYESND